MSNESSPDAPAAAPPADAPKVTKVVKLGGSTVLMIDLGTDSDAPEGEYFLRQITATPSIDEPSGAGLCIDISCKLTIGGCTKKSKSVLTP